MGADDMMVPNDCCSEVILQDPSAVMPELAQHDGAGVQCRAPSMAGEDRAAKERDVQLQLLTGARDDTKEAAGRAGEGHEAVCASTLAVVSQCDACTCT